MSNVGGVGNFSFARWFQIEISWGIITIVIQIISHVIKSFSILLLVFAPVECIASHATACLYASLYIL